MKAYIIIDDEKSLSAITCRNIVVNEETPNYSMCNDIVHQPPTTYHFSTNSVVLDDSPAFVSLPDEVLDRIRDYNIDVEHKRLLDINHNLEQKNDRLSQSITYYLQELDNLKKEALLYSQVIGEIIDEHPIVAAEVALKLGNLDAACYYAEKANEENEL
jgi:hypothetical protein